MAARPVSPAPLPPQPTTFVGREAEVAALAQLLAEPDCRLVTIVGPGGSGKTRLALTAAARAAPAFADGVAFVPLQPVDSAEALPPAIAPPWAGGGRRPRGRGCGPSPTPAG